MYLALRGTSMFNSFSIYHNANWKKGNWFDGTLSEVEWVTYVVLSNEVVLMSGKGTLKDFLIDFSSFCIIITHVNYIWTDQNCILISAMIYWNKNTTATVVTSYVVIMHFWSKNRNWIFAQKNPFFKFIAQCYY